MKETEKKIIEIIDKIRPFLISDGGNIEYIKYEDGIVYVKMMGHCQDCPMIDLTLKDSIEMAITSEIPEVIEVRNINDSEI
ncbi:NifU family protein [bacterium]|jgi:nifU-like protein|nr:NifU family protein [bacterium]